MPEEPKTPEEKLQDLGEKLRAGVEIVRPPSQELLERLLKQENSLKREKKPSKSPDEKRRRRRRPLR